MDTQWHPSSDLGMRAQLERARARELYCTWSITKDKELIKAHLKASEKWYGRGSKDRILNYLRQMIKGEIE